MESRLFFIASSHVSLRKVTVADVVGSVNQQRMYSKYPECSRPAGWIQESSQGCSASVSAGWWKYLAAHINEAQVATLTCVKSSVKIRRWIRAEQRMLSLLLHHFPREDRERSRDSRCFLTLAAAISPCLIHIQICRSIDAVFGCYFR